MHKYTAVISEKAHMAVPTLSESFNVLLLPADETLDFPVRCHADMILFTLGGKAVLPKTYAEMYPSIISSLSSMGLEIIFDPSNRSRDYPHDVGLNVLLCDSTAFSLKEYTSDCVKEMLRESGIRHVNVKQGYAACSALSLGNAVITADRGIEKAARGVGLDTLLISNGYVNIDGYGEGFIGGAAGVCEKRVYFLGNIDTHPDGVKIRDFLKRRGFECVSLFEGGLCDFGGIRFLRNKPHASENRTVQLP